MLSPKKDLLRRQRRWAERAGVAHDARGFVREPGANLRVPLTAEIRAALARGSELEPRLREPARIAALHSSAALVANVFGFWYARDAAPLAAALGLGREHVTLSFEEPFPTGLEGEPPLVDVVLRLAGGGVVAIESKFSEWLVRRPPNKSAFKPKYFPPGRALWAERGLPRCQQLADEIRGNVRRFKQLHAAQLLKHALGLASAAGAAATSPGAAPRIHYLFFDWPSRESTRHRDELAAFASLVGAEIGFGASTYQQLFCALRAERDVDPSYVDYLRSRYFTDL
jgi:hypothetical protein